MLQVHTRVRQLCLAGRYDGARRMRFDSLAPGSLSISLTLTLTLTLPPPLSLTIFIILYLLTLTLLLS